MPEWIKVVYPTQRDVNVNRAYLCQTNETRDVGPPNIYRVDLGPVKDYEPPERLVRVSGTSRSRPKKIVFTPKRVDDVQA